MLNVGHVDVQNAQKLRTYKQFKLGLKVYDYLLLNLTEYGRFILWTFPLVGMLANPKFIRQLDG